MQNGCVVRVDSVADTDLCAPSTAVEDCLCTNQTRPKIKVSAGCLTFDLVNQLSAFESVCGHDTLIAAIKHVEKEASIGGWDASALVQSLSNHQRIWACFNQTDASGKLEDPEEGCARSFFDRYSLTAADENCGTDESGPAAAAAIRTLFSYFTIIAALHTSHVNERSAPGPLVSRLNLATIVLGGHKRWGLNGETTSAAAQQGSPLRMQTLAITIGATRDDGSRVWAPISGFGPDATVSRGGVSEVDGNIDSSFVGDPRAVQPPASFFDGKTRPEWQLNCTGWPCPSPWDEDRGKPRLTLFLPVHYVTDTCPNRMPSFDVDQHGCEHSDYASYWPEPEPSPEPTPLGPGPVPLPVGSQASNPRNPLAMWSHVQWKTAEMVHGFDCVRRRPWVCGSDTGWTSEDGWLPQPRCPDGQPGSIPGIHVNNMPTCCTYAPTCDLSDACPAGYTAMSGREMAFNPGDPVGQCVSGGFGLPCAGASMHTSPPSTLRSGLFTCTQRHRKGWVEVLSEASATAGLFLTAAVLGTAILFFPCSRPGERGRVFSESMAVVDESGLALAGQLHLQMTMIIKAVTRSTVLERDG